MRIAQLCEVYALPRGSWRLAFHSTVDATFKQKERRRLRTSGFEYDIEAGLHGTVA